MECKQNEESPGPDSICHTMMLVVVHVVYENYRKSSDSMESTIVGIHIIKTCVTPPYIFISWGYPCCVCCMQLSLVFIQLVEHLPRMQSVMGLSLAGAANFSLKMSHE